MSKSWQGENDLKNCLNDLVGDCSISKIKHLCGVCFKHQAEYKMVVFEIEKFIKKSPQSDRLAGLFALDALCKASRSQFGKEKDFFSNRFALRLKDTLAQIDYNILPDKEKSIVSRMFDEWRRKEMFGDVVIPVVTNPLPEKESKSKENNSSMHSSSSSSSSNLQTVQPIFHMQPLSSLQPALPPPPMPSLPYQAPISHLAVPSHIPPPVQPLNTYYPNSNTGFNNYPDNTSYGQQGAHQSNFAFNNPQFPQHGMQQPYDNFHNNIGNFNNSYNDNINNNYNDPRNYRNTTSSNYGMDNFNHFDAYNNTTTVQYDPNFIAPKLEIPAQVETTHVDNKVDIKPEKKKTAKVCPFRSGDCPFNEKCRYSHYEWNVSLSSLLDVKKDNNSLVANMNNASNLNNKRKNDNDYQFLFQKFPYPNVLDDIATKNALSKTYQKRTQNIKRQKNNDRIMGNRVVFSSNNTATVMMIRKDMFDDLIL